VIIETVNHALAR